MSHVFAVLLSVPGLPDRFEDYLEDLAACMPVRWRAEHAGDLRLRIDIEVEERPPREVLTAALDAVCRALPHSRIHAVGPDALRLEDIAALLYLPAACLVELQQENPATFPAAIAHEPEHWHLAHVLSWVRAVGAIRVDADLLDIARVALEANEALRARRLGLVA